MVLDFKGFKLNLFDNSRRENLGITEQEREISTKAVKSFQVNGASDQYTLTTSFSEVTGMNVTHTSKTGKVLVLFNCETSPGISEQIEIKLQKDGTDITGTQMNNFISAEPGTRTISISPASWIPQEPDSNQVEIRNNYAKSNGNGINWYCPILLPDGATVKSALVNGSESNEIWYLKRTAINGSSEDTMAHDFFRSTDTSILNATIDNSNYTYGFSTTTLDSTDRIHGAKITYTPERYQFQGENSKIMGGLHYIDENAGKNTWRIVAKTSNATEVDNFINDRILSIIDV